MKVLVTGAQGQLGRELRNVLEARCPGHTLYADVAELDITDAKQATAYIGANDITHIVNCAAYTNVDRCEDDPLAYKVNVEGVRNLAQAARHHNARLIHISSDYVFDGAGTVPYTETDIPRPLNAYGRQKLLSEQAVAELRPDGIVIRTQWLYSPWGHNFVKTILERLQQGQPLRVVNDQIGCPTCAADLAAAIADILLGTRWLPGIYHYSNHGQCSWYQLACAIAEGAGLEGPITPVSTHQYATVAQRPAYSALSKRRIIDTYGVAVPSWRDSLAQMIKSIAPTP